MQGLSHCAEHGDSAEAGLNRPSNVHGASVSHVQLVSGGALVSITRVVPPYSDKMGHCCITFYHLSVLRVWKSGNETGEEKR